MTTLKKSAMHNCVSWFIETKSDVQTQQNYRTKYGRDPPSRPFNSFMEAWTVFDAWRNGRLRASEENIDHVRQAFHCSEILV